MGTVLILAVGSVLFLTAQDVMASNARLVEKVSSLSNLWSATAAFGALAVALAAGRVALKSYRAQTLQVRHLEQDKEAELASKFGLWATDVYAEPDDVIYHNAAAQPVYHVIVTFYVGGLASRTTHRSKPLICGTLGPTREPATLPAAREALVEFLATAARDESAHVGREANRKDLYVLYLEIQFTDGNGRTWIRKHDGTLRWMSSIRDVAALSAK
ncbi:hypothetical protein [Amycolatopsis anabasis]|uniref:hypothetical protein n=1 Tax=Amycolatopsis anabasis TaxID=1840409 RepID=UPI00131B0807|nr:hypothetical protein [Amycolatopsis anabasis]